MEPIHQEGIEVKSTENKGRGVYATKNFKTGDIIEKCPVIVFSPEESKHLEYTILDKYVYAWRTEDDACIPLGYGLIYNHSYSPNARYDWEFDKKIQYYTAIKDIFPGDEICVNYNWEPNDMSPLTDFEVKK